jgi:hypothetical protein
MKKKLKKCENPLKMKKVKKSENMWKKPLLQQNMLKSGKYLKIKQTEKPLKWRFFDSLHFLEKRTKREKCHKYAKSVIFGDFTEKGI